MTHYDVFNGDADGLCALRQLRLANPIDSVRITGVKRDVALLQRVPATAGDSVTVLDVSIDANRTALMSLLERGVTIQYFDHHGAADIPAHPLLHTVIDRRPTVCTGILVDRYLGGAWREWAIAAAFGDNFAAEAQSLAATRSLQPERIAKLQAVGECLNYNAYGEREEDLIVHPAALYDILSRHTDPVVFSETEPVFRQICEARERDLESVQQVRPAAVLSCGAIYILPDQPWCHRVRGVFGNMLATTAPGCAHAVLTENGRSGYIVSVRAPLSDRRNADTLCKRFASGGGRAAAAGINHLPSSALADFVAAFERTFVSTPAG